jgi:hypothetical protein
VSIKGQQGAEDADGFRQGASGPIDLEMIRDTLRYIEGDLRGAPQHAELRSILSLALLEIRRIEATELPGKTNSILGARFVPTTP